MDSFLARDLTWATRQWALLDLREIGEFANGHIPGATSLPRRMIEFRLSEVLPDLSWPVVVYDNGDGEERAALGAMRLAEMGVSAVRVLDGGIAAWRDAGQDLAQGTNVPSKAFGEQVLQSDPITSLPPEALQTLCSDGASLAICDVRTSDEFAMHHLPGAQSLPGFELAAHLPRLAQDYATVVVNCAGRTRSIIGAATARALGFACYAVENGTMGWRLAGYETESGAAAPAPAAPPQDAIEVAARARALALNQGMVPTTAQNLERLRRSSGKNRPYVVDLRPRQAFIAGHIPGAIWLPGGQLIQRTDDYLAVPGAPVVVVDDGDARAPLAAWWLRRMGFANVHVLDGGMPAWRDAGFAIETGRGHTLPHFLHTLEGRFAMLDIAALKARLAQTPAPIVIDVSTSKRFAKGRLPGAVWMSRGWLEAQIAAHATPEDQIILSASDPAQAVLAADALFKRGYGNVSVFARSPTAWAQAGGAMDTGPLPYAPDDIVEPPYEKGLDAMREYLDWEIRLTAEMNAPEQGVMLMEKE
ncbi:rhodanese-like domain-containing protein [Rhodobacteraceae bacterium KMM 6894]|nr:rhodanese-like domain-containing protein [Rhodobacteraceae bacterium KMM 6894]